jgi:DNA-binding GntR family transcriptional regulator
MPALLDDTSYGVLLKEQLASALKQVIVTGRLHAGTESWKPFGPRSSAWRRRPFARRSISRLTEGFLVKDAGRSARVVNYREQDVRHIYEVRAVIEGLAA